MGGAGDGERELDPGVGKPREKWIPHRHSGTDPGGRLLERRMDKVEGAGQGKGGGATGPRGIF